MVSSASAAPLLSVGSYANYQLNASMQSSQSCNATPATYNQTACGPYQPKALVNIYDDGVCATNSNFCYFSPTNLTVAPGTTVMWFNQGKMDHTVTSTTGVAGLSSALIAPTASFSFTFTAMGHYNYSCSIHPWMKATITVAIPTISPPVSSSITPMITLDGSIGWTVNGLDNNVAVLNVSHQVSIVASVGLASFTPATETGSFSQSINLATRVESAGTATSVILGIIQRMLSYYPGYYGYGYSPGLGVLLSSQKEVYTFWWVNGPLSNGQPVQILTGYSSVSGNEMVNLGPGNNRMAWIVTSEISQSVSTNTPPLYGPGGSSYSSFTLDLKFDYDQASDLLLKASAVISISSTQTQTYNPGNYLCGPSGCFPVSVPVTVSHHMSATVPVTLQLTSTNLDLTRRMPTGSIGNGQTSPGGPSGTSTLPTAMSLLIYAGIGIAGAGVVGTLAWLLRRRAGIRAPIAQPGPLPGPSPPVTSA
jgi:plastocyanin